MPTDPALSVTRDAATAREAGPYIECVKCGDRIRSEHRHDFRVCRCKETFVDGGSDYLRCGGYPRMTVEGKIMQWPSDGR